MTTVTVSEKSIQDTIEETLVWDGWLVLRVNSGAMQPDDSDRYVRFVTWQALGWNKQDKGTADLLAMRDGRGVAIECKTDKGRQSTEQEYFELACQERGVEYILARNLSDIAHLLTRVEVDGRPGMRAIEVNND